MCLRLERALRAVVDVDRELRREAPQLSCPVDDDRGGHRDERLPLLKLPRGAERLQGRDDLHGLPESHVVRDDGAHPGSDVVHQPGVTPLLIWPELGIEPLRHLRGRGFELLIDGLPDLLVHEDLIALIGPGERSLEKPEPGWPLRFAAEAPQDGVDFGGARVDVVVPEAHQVPGVLPELRELLLGNLLPAERRLPVKGEERGEAHESAPALIALLESQARHGHRPQDPSHLTGKHHERAAELKGGQDLEERLLQRLNGERGVVRPSGNYLRRLREERRNPRSRGAALPALPGVKPHDLSVAHIAPVIAVDEPKGNLRLDAVPKRGVTGVPSLPRAFPLFLRLLILSPLRVRNGLLSAGAEPFLC